MQLWQRQFVKFCIVGVLNTAVDFGLYYLLTSNLLGFRMHYLAANIVAFLVAVTNSYTLNKRWTFGRTDQRHAVQFTKFFLVNVVSLILYEGLLAFFVEIMDLPDLLGKVFGYGIVLIWNFSAYKYWTFRESSPIL